MTEDSNLNPTEYIEVLETKLHEQSNAINRFGVIRDSLEQRYSELRELLVHKEYQAQQAEAHAEELKKEVRLLQQRNLELEIQLDSKQGEGSVKDCEQGEVGGINCDPLAEDSVEKTPESACAESNRDEFPSPSISCDDCDQLSPEPKDDISPREVVVVCRSQIDVPCDDVSPLRRSAPSLSSKTVYRRKSPDSSILSAPSSPRVCDQIPEPQVLLLPSKPAPVFTHMRAVSENLRAETVTPISAGTALLDPGMPFGRSISPNIPPSDVEGILGRSVSPADPRGWNTMANGSGRREWKLGLNMGLNSFYPTNPGD